MYHACVQKFNVTFLEKKLGINKAQITHGTKIKKNTATNVTPLFVSC